MKICKFHCRIRRNEKGTRRMTSLRNGVKLTLMKKLLLLLLLFLGLMGIASADIVETNTLKLKALNACERCNLQGAILSEANLIEADLSEANLIGADLSGAYLSGANLSEADLSGANLKNVDLSGATLCNTITPWGTDNSGC